VMALDALFALGDEDALFIVGFDPAGEATGFLHYAISSAGSALSLSTMPRVRTVPNGFSEWLICESIAWAREHGVARSGAVGDPNVALGAIEDELRFFAADEIVISTYPPGRSNWLETGVLGRLQEELDIPITHVIADATRTDEVAASRG